MPTRPQLEREVVSLGYAVSDIQLAERLVSLLAVRGTVILPERMKEDADDIWWGMWTGAVVSYARPFMTSRFRIGGRWERFPREHADLGRLHREMRDLRNKVFAHTEALGFRQVWWDWEALQLHEDRASFRREQALAVKRLCGFQMNRIADRIEVILETLHHSD
jgi:glycine/D-amino acid oxidase-like deaminating enzyme